MVYWIRAGGVTRFVCNALKGGGTKKREGETKIFKMGASWVKGRVPQKVGWNPLTNYDSVFAVFRTQSSGSKKPYVQWKGYTRKHTDQESKNKEMIEGIPERDLQNFRLVKLILDSRVQNTTWQLEKKLIVLTIHWKKENQYLLAKVILYTPNEIKSYWKYVRKLYFSP